MIERLKEDRALEREERKSSPSDAAGRSMRRAAPALRLSRLMIVSLLLVVVTGAGETPHRHEIQAVRDQIVEDFGYPPVHVNDSTTILRVERHWTDQIRVPMKNGHSLRVTVELES